MIHNFRELDVWKKSMSLTSEIYSLTKSFPNEELFALTSQMRRSVTSIPANIAEGAGRLTDKELIRFLDISLGSAYELETELIIAYQQKYLDSSKFDTLNKGIIEIQKMLYALIKKYNN